MQLLLDAGADVNTLDSAGKTPLTNVIFAHVRAKDGVCQIDPDVSALIEMLMEAGSDIHMKRCEYSSPLMSAIFMQATPLVSYFLDNGADVNVACKS